MGIDKTSVLPLYYQLKELLLEKIELGEFLPSQQVPSENELSRTHQVSRNTAKQAIASLVNEGILYRLQGKGTFVAKKKVFHGLTEKLSFSAGLSQTDMEVKTRVISAEVVTASSELTRYFKIAENEALFRIQRVREVNMEPIALQTSYLPKKLFPTLLDYDLENSSLFDILEKEFGINLSHVDETLECAIAGKYEAELLKVGKNSAIFILSRKTFSDRGTMIELVRSYMPGERCQFYSEIGERMAIKLNSYKRTS